MPTLHRLESTTDDPHVGGILVTYENGDRKVASWVSRTRVDVPGLAKRLTESLIEDRVKRGEMGCVNWVSVLAGIGALVRDWDQGLGS